MPVAAAAAGVAVPAAQVPVLPARRSPAVVPIATPADDPRAARLADGGGA